MGVCRQCGSINTRELRGSLMARVVTLLLRQRRVACQRCGWLGRVAVVREPGSADHARRSRYAVAADDSAVTQDPNFSGVDAALETENRRNPEFGESADASRDTF